MSTRSRQRHFPAAASAARSMALKRRSTGPSTGPQENPTQTTFSDTDLLNANQKLLELQAVFADALDDSGRLAQLAEHVSTLQKTFQRLRISLQQTSKPFEGYDGFQRTLLSCDLFIRYFKPQKKGQTWTCDSGHIARLEAEIMMQISLLSTSTIVLLAETFFSKDDREPSITMKPRAEPAQSGRESTPDREFEEFWKKIQRVVYGRKRKLLPETSSKNSQAVELEKEVQNNLRQLMLNHQPAPDATSNRSPHLPEIPQSTPLNLEALSDEKLLERTQQQERFLRSASGQTAALPRAVQKEHPFSPIPPARVYTLPDDYDSSIPLEKAAQPILQDGVISITLSKKYHYELARIEYEVIEKKRKIKCTNVSETLTIIHDLPPTVKRYPVTLHPDNITDKSPDITFPERLQVEVKGGKPVAGEAFIAYSFSQPQNVRLLQEMIRDKDLLHTFPVNEMTSGNGTEEASYQNLKIWKDHKTGEHTLSICRNLITKKPYLELPLSSFELAVIKNPKNNRTVQLDVIDVSRDSTPLKRTLSNDPHKAFSSSKKRNSMISLKTTRSDSTVRHKEQMREIGASLQALIFVFKALGDATAFTDAFESAKDAELKDSIPSPFGSPNSSIFKNPSPFNEAISEYIPAQTSDTTRGRTQDLLPDDLIAGAPMIQTPDISESFAAQTSDMTHGRPHDLFLDDLIAAAPRVPTTDVTIRSRPGVVENRETARTCEDYTVGWICALSVEMAAAIAMLDERHPRLPQDWRDKNAYEIGRIGDHNVVITCLPAGMTGNNSAASVATRMEYSFPRLNIRLMVGIGGGVPGTRDIRLGDVVVSKPGLNHGGVVQYDFGKTIMGGVFEKTGSLPAPPPALLAAISHLEAVQANFGSQMSTFLQAFNSENLRHYRHPGAHRDHLFTADYNHVQGEPTCEKCDRRYLQVRPPREPVPFVHYGAIASGNQIMRDAVSRDELGKRYDVLCFEMEAAGLMNMDTFPCIVIRGICDYADTHKNKEWQGYAAATAAAYAKELLLSIPPSNGPKWQPQASTF